MNIFNKIIFSMHNRSKGALNKERTYLLQFSSTIIFIIMAIFIVFRNKNISFTILFLSEGLGQYFLAKENQKTLKEGDVFVSYFKKNSLGFLAALSFSLTILCRYILASHYLYSFSFLVLIGGGISTFVYLLLYLFFPLKKDMLSGLSALVIITSSLFLGFVALLNMRQSFDYQLAINQLCYASLLSLGILFLKPWMAEAINILIWTILFFIIFTC